MLAEALTRHLADTGCALTSHGFPLDATPTGLGALRESGDLRGAPAALRERMAADGYVFVRGYLDRAQVLAARRQRAARLDGVGLIDCGRLRSVYARAPCPGRLRHP